MTSMDGLPRNPVTAYISQAWSSSFALDVDSEAMSFLAGIYAVIEFSSEPYLSEDQLRDVFAIVSEVAHGEPGTIAARATRTTARLREQQLLIRADFGGIGQAGDYALSNMGKVLVEWMVQEEGLTRQSLVTMMTSIRADLALAMAAAEAGGDIKHWESRVTSPLKYSVSGLMQVIDRRSRGLDRDQERVKQEIADLLDARWAHASQKCELLLATVNETIHELYNTAMSEITSASTLLTAIIEAAQSAEQIAAQEAADYVRMQLDRLSTWIDSRFTAWCDYYISTHEYIRAFVQVDPERALRSRLRDAIRNFANAPWTLNILAQKPYLHLRDASPGAQEQRVGRPVRKHEHGLDLAEHVESPWELLVPILRERLAREGRLDVLTVLEKMVPEGREEDKFVLLSPLFRWLAESATPDPLRDVDWHAIGERLSIQNLNVRLEKPSKKGGGRRDDPMEEK